MVWHLKNSIQAHLSGTLRKLRNQSEDMECQSKRIKLQSEKIKLQSEKIKLQSEKIESMERKMDCFSKETFSGVLIWEISDFQKTLDGVKINNEILYKNFFALDGYKIRASLRLNGEGQGKGTHVSLFVASDTGPFDDTLEWPLIAKISFGVMIENEVENSKSFYTDDSDKSLLSFKKPPHDEEDWGYPKFIPLDRLRTLVVEDKLTLKITVKQRTKK